jgi:hypothetical protein
MGATVIAGSRHVPQPEGIATIEGYICLVPLPDGRWRVDVQGISGETCQNGEQAAKRTIEVLYMSPENREKVVRQHLQNVVRLLGRA